MKPADRIKVLRERAGLTQTDFAEKLKLSRSAVSMYEKGTRTPSTYVYEAIADFFNVDVDYLMGRTDKITVLPERLKYENSKKSEHIVHTISSMEKLNETGQRKVSEYADDLFHTGNYLKHSAKPVPKPLTIAPAPAKQAPKPVSYVEDYEAEEEAYSVPIMAFAAAGRGYPNYNGTDEFAKVYWPSHIPDSAHIIQIKGESLSPLYEDGDLVWCEFTAEVKQGKVHVVIYDGETYIKKIFFGNGKIEMVSVNPDFDTITIEGDDLDSFHVRSIVLEKAERA